MARSVNVESVSVNVEITSENFKPTSINVERSTTKEANMATVKGVFPEGDVPEQGDRVRVYINTELVFTGRARYASRNSDHLYTIEAFDHTRELQNITENVSTDDGKQWNAGLARDLLWKNGIDNNVERPLGQYRGDNGPTTHEYNSETLDKILDNLAGRLDGYWWVDEHNIVQFHPDPNVNWHYLDRIVEVSAGDSEASSNQITVFGGAPTSESGQEAATMFAHNQVKSTARITYGSGDDSQSKEFKVKDQTINTQLEVDAFLDSEIGKFAEDLKEGNATIVGDETITPHDTVFVPQEDGLGDLVSGEYMAKVVRHKVDNRNGFVTELELGLPYDSVRNVVEETETPE